MMATMPMSCHAMPWRVRVMHVERTVHDMYNQKPPEQTPNAGHRQTALGQQDHVSQGMAA